LNDLLQRYAPAIWNIWVSGGWCMVPLLVVSLFIYGLGAHLLWFISVRRRAAVDDQRLKLWVSRPDQADGLAGEIIRYTQTDANSVDEIRNRFSEVNAAEIPAVERRLALMNVMVNSAPLLGLLGTVLGMLKTFQAIAVGTGKTVDLVAQGISEALITTEMGLLIAIPGYLMVYLIKRRKDEYVAFLARLESYTHLEFEKPSKSHEISPLPG
jgi:biopolymer transport protein ExbB